MNIATAYVELRVDSSKGKAQARSEAKKLAAGAGTVDVPMQAKAGGRELGQARSTGRQLAGEVVKGAAGIFATGVLFAGLNKSIGAASQLEQAVGGTTAVFKQLSPQIDTFAKSAANMVGLSERAARELTTRLGGALKGLGFDLDDAATKSIDLVKVGADLAATYGGTTADAVQAIGAAFRGEFESAEQFNIFLKQSTVDAKAVELGLASSTTKVDQFARAQATMALIMEQSGDATGQFAREIETTAGQTAIATAKMENAQASLGQKLAPVYTQIVQVVGAAADVFARLPGPVQLGVVALAGFVALSGPIRTTIDVIRDASPALQKLRSASGTAAAGVSLLAVAVVAWQASQARAAEKAQAFAEGVDEMTRAADGGVAVLGGLLVAADAFDDASPEETFAKIAKEQLGAAISARDALAANDELAAKYARLGLTVEDMTTAIDAEVEAQRRAEQTAKGAATAVDDLGAATEETASALERGIIPGLNDTEALLRATKDAVDDLFGQFSDESALIDLQDGFAGAREALERYNTEAAEEGATAEQNAANLRAYRQELLSNIAATKDYVTEILELPAERATNIVAAIDRGDLDAAERALEILTRNRTANILITGRRGAGFDGGFGGGAVPFAAGGIVRARSGGLPATIGEAGVDEAVIPLTTATLAAIGNAIAIAGQSASRRGGAVTTFGTQVEDLGVLLNAVRGLASGVLSQRSDSRGLTGALRDYAKAVRLAGDDVRDYKEDVEDLQAAEDNVITSAIALSEATARQAEMHAAAAGASFTAADAADVQADKLREIAEALPEGSVLAAPLLELANGLYAVRDSAEAADKALANVLDLNRARTDADTDAYREAINLERATLRYAEALAHVGEGRQQELDLAEASLNVVDQAQKLADVRVQQGLAAATAAGSDFTSADAARIQAMELRRLANGIGQTPGFEGMVARLLDLAQLADVAAASADAGSIILNKRAAGGPVGAGDFLVGERGNGAEWLHLEPGSRGYVTNARDSAGGGLSIGQLIVGDRRDLTETKATLASVLWEARFR